MIELFAVAGCLLLSAAGSENSVAIRVTYVPRTTHPLQYCFRLDYEAMLERFVCFGILERLDFKDYQVFVMLYFFSKKSIATAGCSALGLFGLLDGDVEMSFYFLHALELSLVVMKGYHFGQVGVNNGHAGVLFVHQFSRLAGAYPLNMILLTPAVPRCR